jgi:P-type E1-E2 ATPase
VFDKTGTLTNASPVLTDIETYGSYSREEVLRLAACLEEHFPHPVARAVVNKAEEEHLEHREKHAKVEYIVAHGITSSLNGKRVVIGSEHFVTEDEHVTIEPEALDAIHERAKGGSPLFLAIDNKLQGVLYINDPIKPQANETIQALKNAGFTRVVMLTGDNQRAAAHIAKQAGIEEFYADLLPEDKRRIIRQLQHEGYEVAMVGDGVNDSPALSAANISIAMNDASAIARETADITLVANELDAILKLRNLSSTLQNRMQRGYKFTIGFNSALLALGIAGILTPTTSSLLHNGSTVALSVANTRPLLK